MRVESAGFGEVHGGHALLGCSDVERSRYSDIVSKTDRPGYAPPGLTWSPYISGFPWRGHYYLVKTFPDSSASRSGMVFSYALELNLEEISHCSALGKLTDLLSATVTKPAEYKSIEIATGLSDSTTGVDGRLAECLVSAQSGESVVWLGEGGFVDAITALWACMWPETRATFSFRLAFDPQDLDVDHPTLVLTPSQLESRWAEHPIVQRSTQTVTTAGSALARQPGGEALRALKQSIGARILHPRELRLLEQVYSTLTAATTSTAQGRSALHLIGRLCPSPKNGGPEKSQLFQQTAAAVAAEEDAAEIRAFRNLNLEAFEDPQALLVAIEEWISKNILRDSQDKTLGSILELAFEGQHYLSDRVRNGLRMSLQGRKEKDVNVFWAWMQGTPNHAGDLMELAVSSGWSDTLLASGCPSLLDKRVGDMLLPFTREHDLSVCYSAIAAATLRPEEAIRSYLELGITLPHPASGMLIDRIGAPAVVQFAKTSDDVRGTSLALEALHGNPALLQPVDLDSANWMRLFTSAVRSDIQISKLLSGRSDSFKVFDSVLTGGILDSVSWEALSESEFSNIVDYQQRSALWAHIPAPHRAQFLLGTAKGWLELFANHPDAPHEIESELDSVVLRTVRGQYFDVATLVRLCYALSSLDEELFIDLLQQSLAKSAISLFSAEKLGALVAEKQWARAANHLFAWSDRRTDVVPAVAKCLNLLSRWQRLRAIWLKNVNNASHPTADDLWAALEELGIELYSWGPNDRDIWERAGGDRAAVRVQTNGRESWHDVINQARRGGGGNVTLRSLASAMREDYGWNDVLQRISQYLGN